MGFEDENQELHRLICIDVGYGHNSFFHSFKLSDKFNMQAHQAHSIPYLPTV